MSELRTWIVVCQECGETMVESQTEPTECPNNSGHVIGEVRCLHSTAPRSLDHVSLITEIVSTILDTWEVMGRCLFNASKFDNINAEVVCYVKKGGGGSGYLRIYDFSNAQTLGTLEFNNSVPQPKIFKLSNMPNTGPCLIEFQLKTDGIGRAYVISACIGMK